MPVIESTRYKARIVPERGGLIAGLHYADGDVAVDLLRPEPTGGAYADGLPLFGCFPMVPFANRLSAPELPLGSGAARFPVNWPSEGVAMHGVGFGVPWKIEATDDKGMCLAVQIEDAEGRQLGMARQDISLSDEDGLRVRLRYEHLYPETMAAGIGLHPWFQVPRGEDDFTVRFHADSCFEMGPDHFPVGCSAINGDVELSRHDDGLDTCFPGWGGLAQLNRPSRSVAVRVRSDARIVHCFIAGALDAVCLEPVSHIPDAVHRPRWRSKGPMRPLQPGEEISLEMTLSALRYDSTAGDNRRPPS